MSLTISESAATRELAPAGPNVAICTSIIDLGTTMESYQGGEPRPRKKVWIEWELSEEVRQDKDGNPFCLSVSKKFTASLSEKGALRQMLNSWRGKPFEPEELRGWNLTNVLGAPCMINIIHEPRQDGNGERANIASIMKLPKSTAKPQQVNPTRLLDLDDFDKAVFDSLPDFLKKDIEASMEWAAINEAAVSGTFKGNQQPVAVEEEDQDSLPF